MLALQGVKGIELSFIARGIPFLFLYLFLNHLLALQLLRLYLLSFLEFLESPPLMSIR